MYALLIAVHAAMAVYDTWTVVQMTVAKFKQANKKSSQGQSYIMTDSQSASPSWCQEPIWDPRPISPILSFISS
jgi:hypothetical protein